MLLEFEKQSHAYKVDGQIVPSVTTVINAVLPGFQAAAYYLEKGAAIHRGCELSDAGTLDPSTVAPEIAGYIRAWESFRAAWPSKTVLREKPLSHPVYRFAGTLDAILEVDGDLTVCDIKSGAIEPQSMLQVAFYSLLVASHTGRRPRRAVVVALRDTGSFTCKWLAVGELRRAEQQALAVLTVYGFMQSHGLTHGVTRKGA